MSCDGWGDSMKSKQEMQVATEIEDLKERIERTQKLLCTSLCESQIDAHTQLLSSLKQRVSFLSLFTIFSIVISKSCIFREFGSKW